MIKILPYINFCITKNNSVKLFCKPKPGYVVESFTGIVYLDRKSYNSYIFLKRIIKKQLALNNSKRKIKLRTFI